MDVPGAISKPSLGFTPVRPLGLPPMFAIIVDHGGAQALEALQRMPLDRAADLQEVLVASGENKWRAHKASKDRNEIDPTWNPAGG